MLEQTHICDFGAPANRKILEIYMTKSRYTESASADQYENDENI